MPQIAPPLRIVVRGRSVRLVLFCFRIDLRIRFSAVDQCGWLTRVVQCSLYTLSFVTYPCTSIHVIASMQALDSFLAFAPPLGLVRSLLRTRPSSRLESSRSSSPPALPFSLFVVCQLHSFEGWSCTIAATPVAAVPSFALFTNSGVTGVVRDPSSVFPFFLAAASLGGRPRRMRRCRPRHLRPRGSRHPSPPPVCVWGSLCISCSPFRLLPQFLHSPNVATSHSRRLAASSDARATRLGSVSSQIACGAFGRSPGRRREGCLRRTQRMDLFRAVAFAAFWLVRSSRHLRRLRGRLFVCFCVVFAPPLHCPPSDCSCCCLRYVLHSPPRSGAFVGVGHAVGCSDNSQAVEGLESQVHYADR